MGVIYKNGIPYGGSGNSGGSGPSDYGIVQNSSELPTLAVTDRKIYFSIADDCFWLWNGTAWVMERETRQYNVIPTAASIFVDRIIQYTGATDSTYTCGAFYRCSLKDGAYIWEELKTNQTEELTQEDVNSLISILN